MERTGTTYAPQTTNYNFRATSTEITFSDYPDFHGVYLETADDELNAGAGFGNCFRDCTFSVLNASESDAQIRCGAGSRYESCTFKGTGTNAGIVANVCVFEGCEWVGGSNTTQLVDGNENYIVGGKFSPSVSPTTLFSYRPKITHMESDEISPGTSLIETSSSYPTFRNTMFASDDVGVSAGRDWMTQSSTPAGVCFPTTAVYRNSGWQDAPSETNLSWKLATASSSTGVNGYWLLSPPITSRIEETGSTTFTAYGVHDSYTTAPKANEIIMRVFYLGTADSTRWHLASTQDPTGASLTSDTSDWTGASGKTKFKLAETVTVNNTGEYMVDFVMKKYEAGNAIWIDPLVEIA